MIDIETRDRDILLIISGDDCFSMFRLPKIDARGGAIYVLAPGLLGFIFFKHFFSQLELKSLKKKTGNTLSRQLRAVLI